jgi:hypothetical protein
MPTAAPRPLPDHLSLEFERKHAKRLLRALRAGEPDALARSAALPTARRRRADWKLADAQLISAREYGFSSWPQLVRYFETWVRHEATGHMTASYSADHHEQRVRHLLALHQRRLPGGAHALAAFVPRFIGKSNDEIFATTITDDEVRLAVARMERFPNWDALMRSVSASDPDSFIEEFRRSPFGHAVDAIRNGDLDSLKKITATHPELLDPDWRGHAGSTLVGSAWIHHRRHPGAEADAVLAWLESQGLVTQRLLDESLNGISRLSKAADIRFLLDKGANPTWGPPGGISLLERALMVCWDPESVDLIAARVTPVDAFWVHAGLGDTAAMRRYFTAKGLTATAHENRPDFLAVNLRIPQRQEADDAEVMWEAFLIAGVNQRAAAIDLLLAHGLDIDAAPWGQPLLNFAVGNRLVRLVEILMERGASPAVRGFMPTHTARELAAEQYQGEPLEGALARIRELVG